MTNTEQKLTDDMQQDLFDALRKPLLIDMMHLYFEWYPITGLDFELQREQFFKQHGWKFEDYYGQIKKKFRHR